MRSRHLRNSSLVALLVAAAPIMAQGVSAQLGGRVLDTKGLAVPGATVVIRNTETGLTRTLQTSDEGRYMATLLPVGPYIVTVTKVGYQTAGNVKVNLNLGDAAPLTIRLATETSAVVEVTASAPQVDAERASSATIISPDNLVNLPVFNRSFTNLATLAPQVVIDTNRGNLAIAGQRGVNTSINIDGGDNNEAFFGGAMGAAEGKAPFSISIEAIREYQVVTDGASAEFGRMGGGYVNAITKNGTNDLSGSLFYYTRPRIFVEAGPTLLQSSGSATVNPVGDFKQEQFGFSVGGPIVKDKLFYFVAYDAQRLKTPINQSWGGNAGILVADGGPLNPANAADAVLIGKAGNYTSKGDTDTMFARFDWNINVDQSLQLRVNHTKYKGDTGAAQNAASENLATDNNTTDTYVLQWNWVLTGNWMNEFRINYAKEDAPRSPYSTTPELNIANVGFYGAYPFDRTFNTKRTQFQENISYVTPTLQIKAGVDYNSIDVSEFFAGNWRGVYIYTATAAITGPVAYPKRSALENYRLGLWSTYRQNFGLSSPVQQAGLFSATEKQEAAFIQADWRATDTLKVGLGVRWDRQDNPDYPILDMSNPTATTMPITAKIPTDSQISPRLSFTWTPAADQGKTVVRGSIGRYVSTTPAVFQYQAYAANGVRTGQVDFNFKAATPPTPTNPAGTPLVDDATKFGIPRGAAFNPATPFWFSSFPTGATAPKVDIWTYSPNFKNPYTDRVNVGAERPFVTNLVLGLSATYAKGNQLERTEDLNISASTGTSAQGRPLYGARPNPNYLRMGYYLSDATSIYHAYTASLKYHNDDSTFDTQFFYTYSSNKDSDSNERNYSGVSIQDQGQIGKQWGYADSDRRQILTGYMSFLDKNLTGVLFSLSIRYQTGTPYTMMYTNDQNGDLNTGNDRYYQNGLDSGRNTQRAGSTINYNLGLRRDIFFSKQYKMTLSADIFNLFNRQDTYVSYKPTSASTDAAPALQATQNWTNAGSARQVQVGARFAF